MSDLAKQRSEGLKDPLADESLKIRFETWDRVLDEIADEPLGSGLGTVGHATSTSGKDSVVFTDNSYLKIVREQGVIVGPLFVLALLAFIGCHRPATGARRPGSPSGGTAALSAFVGFMLLAVMAEYFEQPGKALAWTMLGIAAWDAFCGERRGTA